MLATALYTAVFLFACLGALVSRWHGGGFDQNTSKVAKNFAWAVPIGIVCSLVWYFYSPYIWFGSMAITAATIFGLVTAAGVPGKGTGHGGGMDLGTHPDKPNDGRKPEKLEYLILWLHGKMPEYWYDVLLMAIVGTFSVLGALVALAAINPLAGLFVAAGGALKAPSYMLGWLIYPDSRGDGWHELDEATEVGEFLSGFFAFLGVAAGAAVIVNAGI